MAIRLSQAAWTEIKRLYMAGHGAPKLSQRFGISAHAIYKRSAKERWRDDFLAESIEPAQEDISELAAAVRRLATAVAAQNQVEAV